MNKLKIFIDKTSDFVSEAGVHSLFAEIERYNSALHEKTGRGSEFLGWVDLPSSMNQAVPDDINQTVYALKNEVAYVVVIGIGGSYLGSRAVIEALSDSFKHLGTAKNYPEILYAGHNVSADYHHELLGFLKDKQYALIVISKSGTTIEPAIAFRILKNQIEQLHGKEIARQRIIAVTDSSKGALKALADKNGYKTYIIPDDVGGRFSVLTPVGLLPIAFAGFNIKGIIEGARDMEIICRPGNRAETNPAILYASVRNTLLRKGYDTELLVNYNPKMNFLAEWWKQLFGESEGKEHKGIFPASAGFTTDLHSMGQYIQDGRRNIFETIISVTRTRFNVYIPSDQEDLDKLNFLAGKELNEVSEKAELGTIYAHVDGGVPNIRIEIPMLNEYFIGQLIYFFEKSCGLSGYLLGVNPFDQPGVEAYKKNMFALLGKPGFENLKEKLRNAEINRLK